MRAVASRASTGGRLDLDPQKELKALRQAVENVCNGRKPAVRERGVEASTGGSPAAYISAWSRHFGQGRGDFRQHRRRSKL